MTDTHRRVENFVDTSEEWRRWYDAAHSHIILTIITVKSLQTDVKINDKITHTPSQMFADKYVSRWWRVIFSFFSSQHAQMQTV